MNPGDRDIRDQDDQTRRRDTQRYERIACHVQQRRPHVEIGLGLTATSIKIVLQALNFPPVKTVNVKVKSGEHLDAVGREEAIAAQAMCLIEAV